VTADANSRMISAAAALNLAGCTTVAWSGQQIMVTLGLSAGWTGSTLSASPDWLMGPLARWVWFVAYARWVTHSWQTQRPVVRDTAAWRKRGMMMRFRTVLVVSAAAAAMWGGAADCFGGYCRRAWHSELLRSADQPRFQRSRSDAEGEGRRASGACGCRLPAGGCTLRGNGLGPRDDQVRQGKLLGQPDRSDAGRTDCSDPLTRAS
jgi:hypothetical protein